MLARKRRPIGQEGPSEARALVGEQGFEAAEGVEDDPRWSDSDREALKRSVRSLWEAQVRTPIGSAGSAEMASLLTCPRDEVRDRALTAIGTINMVTALVFSGLLGAAIEPKDAEAYWAKSAWQGRCVEALNIIVAVATTISAIVTLFSTYILMQISVEPSTTGIYRAMAHVSWFFGLMVTLTGVMNFLLVGALLLALALTSSALAFRIGLVLVLASMMVLIAVFMEAFQKAFPDASLTWSTLFWPVGLRQALREDAKRAGVAKTKDALALHGSSVFPFANAGAGGGEDGAAAQGYASQRRIAAPEERPRLERLLAAALPYALPAHLEHITGALLRAGLTFDVLRGASGHDAALQSALDRVGEYGAELLPGEVLAIITAVGKYGELGSPGKGSDYQRHDVRGRDLPTSSVPLQSHGGPQFKSEAGPCNKFRWCA